MQQLYETISSRAMKTSGIGTKYDFSDAEEMKKEITETMHKPHEFLNTAGSDVAHPIEEKETPSTFFFLDALAFNSIIELDSKTRTEFQLSVEDNDSDPKEPEFIIEGTDLMYLIDFSAPLEMNAIADSLRFNDDIKIELLPKKTRLALAIAASCLSASLLAALIALPPPYNWASAIALGGPLFVSSVGLLTQKR